VTLTQHEIKVLEARRLVQYAELFNRRQEDIRRYRSCLSPVTRELSSKSTLSGEEGRRRRVVLDLVETFNKVGAGMLFRKSRLYWG
jgi:hypothetical protein